MLLQVAQMPMMSLIHQDFVTLRDTEVVLGNALVILKKFNNFD